MDDSPTFGTSRAYGIVCERRDEKVLVAAVNGYLATLSRTTSKAKNQSLLDAFAPFVYKYFYWNLNKDTGTYFRIFPNEDVNHVLSRTGAPQCAWLMEFLAHDRDRFPAGSPEKAESFLSGLLAAMPFEAVLLEQGYLR